MSIKSNNKIFYEAIWFGFDREETPIIRSKTLNNLVNTLIDYTRGQSGTIEVYKFEYNNLGHAIDLVQKLDVLDELSLVLK